MATDMSCPCYRLCREADSREPPEQDQFLSLNASGDCAFLFSSCENQKCTCMGNPYAGSRACALGLCDPHPLLPSMPADTDKLPNPTSHLYSMRPSLCILCLPFYQWLTLHVVIAQLRLGFLLLR